jgi:SAM-dependent methyltransferase
MTGRATCIVCAGTRVTPILRIDHAPVYCSHLCPDRDAALKEPTASISLGFCADCGHIFNIEYDSTKLNYRPGYENSLQGSEHFRTYDDTLVTLLLDRYGLRGRVILELGCGRGHFLRALCERGANSGFGFDPSYSGEEGEANEASNVIIRAEVFGTQNEQLNADFICSRHTLEHVGDPRGFLLNMRSATDRSRTPLFFEVPNGLYTLRDGGIWDIIYEHRSYFTPSSLARVFCETGYDCVEVTEAFSGQFLNIHAIMSTFNRATASVTTHDLDQLVKSFAHRYYSKIKEWTCRLRELEGEGRRIVIWGAGAKATTFLNLLRPASIGYVVDVNSRKHGKYMLGTGQEIVPPDFLSEYLADDIICMNPNYREEIANHVRALGIDARIVTA